MSRSATSSVIRLVLHPAALAMIMALLVVFPVQAQKRLALVIGNDAYENVTKLKKAVNDARVMGDTLATLGFGVTVGQNLTRREMNKVLQTFNNSINKGDIALLFFAGHGIEIEGENYLLPVDIPDAKGNQLEFIRAESVRLNGILADLRAKNAGLNLVILDACRNNPFSGSGTRSLGGARGLARISAPQGTFVMYSADVGEAALDRLSDEDTNPNSIFTRTLVPLMKTPGFDLVDTARETRRRVRKLALTVSHNQTPAYYDAVLGDFYFTPLSTSAGQSGTVVQATLPPAIEATDTSGDKLASLGDTKGNLLKDQIYPPATFNIPLPAIVATAGEKDLIRVWDVENHKLLGELNGEKKIISTIKLIDNGRSLLVAGEDGSVVAYSLPLFKKTGAFYPDFTVSVLSQATDGTIMAGGEKGILVAFDRATFQENWRRQAHDGIVSPILPQGDHVVSASADGAIVVTDVHSGEEIGRAHTFAGGKITDIALVSRTTVVAVHEKGEIAYINISTGKILSAFKGHDGWISSVDITPDHTAIVTAGVNGNLRYWSLGGTSLIASVPAHSDVASGAKYLSIGSNSRLASVGFDGALRIWDSSGDNQIAELEHGPAILHFDYSSSR